uniref:Uncharacterized protein n=1 Tax=Timspurckia oligopyrenoides TaxID=708627 RepID=A0A7S1EU30_9RHOD|mmetsp:Transcript_7327/g.13229  ORF Transcript_7327/g.13229 Transcript_7327/m.13229 type:complete len:370 (+) Transcript_7327:305-1414(+)|eukprot:CAMPEP_0182447206 /NCGR_PEP_ID=MMETSP1172-20130603/12783_1 /TAXON_ID=708627 /ORGANISM="Timspurckia oligopyrenoides, Strain CCMP3278" /LENGTH=369 /DNA_ID=CAMNT_0024643557 /DNA_START=198 /DNA_END=1307 /DNA_ORIENTATION=+
MFSRKRSSLRIVNEEGLGSTTSRTDEEPDARRSSFFRNISRKSKIGVVSDADTSRETKSFGNLDSSPSLSRSEGAPVSPKPSSRVGFSLPRNSSRKALNSDNNLRKENSESSPPVLSRNKSSLTQSAISADSARDPNEGGSFRSFHSSKSRKNVFQVIDSAEKTSFVSKLKYEELMLDLEDTLLAQHGTHFVRKKNVIHFEVPLKKSVLHGEIKVIELIGECRAEFRKKAVDKDTDYWTFVEYFRRFERELREREPDAVVAKRTIRETYREQKLAQQEKEMRDKAMEVERKMIRNQPNAEPAKESEYERLQKIFSIQPSGDESMSYSLDGREESNKRDVSALNAQAFKRDEDDMFAELEKELVDIHVEE